MFRWLPLRFFIHSKTIEIIGIFRSVKGQCLQGATSLFSPPGKTTGRSQYLFTLKPRKSPSVSAGLPELCLSKKIKNLIFLNFVYTYFEHENVYKNFFGRYAFATTNITIVAIRPTADRTRKKNNSRPLIVPVTVYVLNGRRRLHVNRRVRV